MTNIQGSLSEIDAAPTGLKPDKKLQRPFGIRAGVPGYDQHVETLARNPEEPGKPGFLSPTAERTQDGCGNFIPKRSVRPRTERSITKRRSSCASQMAHGSGGGVGGGDDGIGQRYQLIESAKWNGRHLAIVCVRIWLSSIK